MKVEVVLDKTVEEKIIRIITNNFDEELREIEKLLSNPRGNHLLGYKGEKATVIKLEDIYRVYISQRKLYVDTEKETFICKNSYKDIRDSLLTSDFFEISRSEIVNLNKIRNLDFSYKGTICLYLLNGTLTYLSRRRVEPFKEKLGIKRR